MGKLTHSISFHSRKAGNRFFSFFQKMIEVPWKLITYSYLKFHGVETGYGHVKMYGFPLIRKCKGSSIILGDGCTLVSTSKHNLAGINHRVILATLAPGAVINIGRAGVSGSSVCAVKGIYLGDNSGLGANSSVYDTDFHPIDVIGRRNQNNILQANYKEVRIGKDVWIASNVLILKGVTIGDNAVIGAGSVVTSAVPANTIYAGNPAKKIRDL